MRSYDPEIGQRAEDWLDLDEVERIELVAAYHRRERIKLPNARLHAIFHTLIENQLAANDPDVIGETLARLRNQGLSRHDAVHAISNVLIEILHKVWRDGGEAFDLEQYIKSLKSLTAKDWLNSGS